MLATLDAKRVICLCVVIFASDGMKTQIVIYPNNRIIVNIIKVDTMVSTINDLDCVYEYGSSGRRRPPLRDTEYK